MQFLNDLWIKHYKKCLVICYWFLGLCNNYAYVVMLSAAHDLLSDHTNSTTPTNTTSNHTNKFDCNNISTGAVLLADIVPGIIIKLTAPFFIHHFKYPVRVTVVIIACALSFILVSVAPSNMKWLTFIGVCCASISSSLGEITFLSLSTLYDRILALSGWGSGTGAAGVFGALSYAALTSAGLSPKNSILVMLFVPVLMVFSYILLPPPSSSKYYGNDGGDDDQREIVTENPDNTEPNLRDTDEIDQSVNDKSSRLNYRIKEIKRLLKYMIPLFLVYFAEYFINQGLFELLYFKDAFLKSHKEQYRWYSVCYQLAVFVSRSSISIIQIKFLPIFPILQLANVAIVLTQLFYGYMNSIWYIFLIIFWEGLLGGGCYVNAFNLLSIEVPKSSREFSIAIASVADTFGITLAGFTSIPVHNAICKYGEK